MAGNLLREMNMGKNFRSPWVEEEGYILHLVTNLVGEHTLRSLAHELQGRDGQALRVFLWGRLEPKIKSMNDSTLGRIVAYGTVDGFHHGPPCQVYFLNLTGFKHVMNWTLDPTKKSGRELQEEIALLTIVCVARDIIMQREWQAQAVHDLDEDAQFERGMKNYAHRGQRS